MSTTDRYKEAGLRPPKNVGPTTPIVTPPHPYQPAPATTTGDPTESWTIQQLRDHALANDVDLTGLTLKADILSAVTAATPTPSERNI